jgi:two-component system chemotaxis response regulator CheY
MEHVCLVVEDSPMMRQLIVFTLKRIGGLRVVEAADGLEALRHLAAQRFDIVLTDINMPVMDGLKLVHRVRADPTHAQVPIVIISTEGGSEDQRRAFQLGATEYITKPIKAPQVTATVERLLGLTSRERRDGA